MPDYGSPDGVEEAADMPAVDDGPDPVDPGVPASLPTGGFADMGAGQTRTVSDLARQVDDRPEVPELMDPPKTVIDATDDFKETDFAEVGEEPMQNATTESGEAIGPSIDYDGRHMRELGMRIAAQNHEGRSIPAEDMIDEAAMYADFIRNGYQAD